MSIFNGKKKKEDDGIVILSKPPENACGGTTKTLDTKAPKSIDSHEMVYFSAESALGWVMPPETGRRKKEPLMFISAHAVPGDDGSFVYYENSREFRGRGNRAARWAYVKENVFPKLDIAVREMDLIKSNGLHSTTHGLPENFGGSVHIEYDGGEAISFSNNQSPVLSRESADRIDSLFEGFLEGEKVALPDSQDVCEIMFEEKRKDGGFTKADLVIGDDGTAVNKKASRYSDPKIYESEKPVDAETVSFIKDCIGKNGMPAWATLPEKKYEWSSEKTLTFVYKDGQKITVTNAKRLPQSILDAFFKIELEITTKH